MSTESLLERNLHAQNARDIEDTLATLAPDCVIEDLAMGRRFTGHPGAREHYRMWWDAFAPTITAQRIHWALDGEAAAEIRWRGYHDGEFLAIKPTHREIDVPAAVFFTFGEEELIADARLYYDLATIRRQLSAG